MTNSDSRYGTCYLLNLYIYINKCNEIWWHY